ncbi:glycoside hydrolase family 19 protein [Paraburkholderia adhaesiva]|uniref:glycoside hydrolase family 19 protein n=1 Tax=Paraburkholderia adhaesiva TaxID=2883244 RepID=UPI001F30D24A|nr:glycoside hydrolase family 19 protein [Paraburkholderia adhaesiva]
MDQLTFQRAASLSASLTNRWFTPVSAAMSEFGINTPARQAAFIAQMRHESGGFTQLVESFNYRPEALAIFSRVPVIMRAKLGRQTGETVVPIARQQQIANLAYGGRYGNGDAASGDGWRYRGRGLKQVTFRDNYAAAGKALGIDLVANPDLLATNDSLAARSAGWFWSTNGCNAPADRSDFAGTTRIINGPAMEGQAARVVCWDCAKKALGLA